MSGNIYLFTPSGSRSVFANGVSPGGLALDVNGNLFEADDPASSLNRSVFEFSPSGVKTLFASGLSAPFDLTFDSHGNLFVASDTLSGGAIYKYSPNGTQTTFIGSGLKEPFSIAFDSAGNLFEADANSGNIFEFAPSGTRTTFASGLSHPSGLAFAPNGDLYAGASALETSIDSRPTVHGPFSRAEYHFRPALHLLPCPSQAPLVWQ
jgi:sugar lactone lactonase YvrE